MEKNITPLPLSYKQFVIIPKKPWMSPGKLISQGCHATFMALQGENKTLLEEWKKKGMCVIVLRCKNIEQLSNIAKYLEQWKIKHYLYIDEGVTEVEPMTPTALATGILTEDKYWMFKKFELF